MTPNNRPGWHCEFTHATYTRSSAPIHTIAKSNILFSLGALLKLPFVHRKTLNWLFTLVQVLNLNLPAVPQNYVKIYLDHFSLNNVS